MKRIALILSGCGYKNGTEITEAIALITGLERLGADLHFYAPKELMEESAKITRSKINDLDTLKVDGFDALALPGGFGAAKNLSTWATKGAACDVLPAVTKAIKAFYNGARPIAAVCIAPVLLAKTLGQHGITVTIGNDAATAAELTKTGAIHEDCPVGDYITDRDHKIITSPAFMYDDAKFHEVFDGIQGLTKELMEMA